MVLGCLATGTAYSEPPPNKPFKVCPEIVTAKDTPCRVLGPTTAVVARKEVPDEAKKNAERIAELQAKVNALEEENRQLKGKSDR